MAPNEKGMGRPFTGSDRKSTMLRVRMEPAKLYQLDQLAKVLATTRSEVIREALARLADQYLIGLATTSDDEGDDPSADALRAALADLNDPELDIDAIVRQYESDD